MGGEKQRLLLVLWVYVLPFIQELREPGLAECLQRGGGGTSEDKTYRTLKEADVDISVT